MRRCDEELLDKVFFARAHAFATGASPTLLAIGRDGSALHVAGVAQRDGNLLVGDEVFEVDLGGFVLNDGAAVVAVVLLDLFELFDDDVAQLLLGCQDGFVLGDALAHVGQLFEDLVDRQARQAMQLEFEDCVGLGGVERTR